jgi:hypothetical protein
LNSCRFSGSIWILANDIYNLAAATIFDLTASASSWEPFQCTIESLSKVFMNRPGLILKHKKFLNMIGWAELDPITPIVPAFAVRLTKESSPPMGLKRTYLRHIHGQCATSWALQTTDTNETCPIG